MEGHASNGAPPSPDPHVHVVNPRSSIKADEYYYSDEELNPQVEVYGEHEPSDFFKDLGTWFKSWALPGIGMFCESYFIFSIGNVDQIFAAAYPDCWRKYTACQKQLVWSETYVQVAGIIIGMLTLGFVGDLIGRKWGSVTTASLMFIGAILLTAADGVTIKGLAAMYMVAQFIFGYGVGGEYPMASASASERAEASKKLRFRRGEMVVLTFAMQGWGNFINTAVLILLMLIFHQNHPPYSRSGLGAVWRVSFGIGLIPVTGMLLYRLFGLKESKVWSKETKESMTVAEKEESSFHRVWMLFYWFWHRLAGTALAWFFWDVSFYGNKLFQSTFINIISGGRTTSILTNLLWTLLNSGVALIGYYFAAFTVDKRWMGRVRMQIMGFFFVTIIFLMCAIFYGDLVKPGANIRWFQFLYFFSSFWGQWGPNATTWLLPGEVFPTEVRGTGHGISAATGKAGALLAGVWFHYIGNKKKFYVTAFFNLAGLLFTILFVPDIMRLDLREGDRRWHYIKQGREKNYLGEAINPVNLSLYERLTGQGRNYDAGLDAKMVREEINAAQERRRVKAGDAPGAIELQTNSPPATVV